MYSVQTKDEFRFSYVWSVSCLLCHDNIIIMHARCCLLLLSQICINRSIVVFDRSFVSFRFVPRRLKRNKFGVVLYGTVLYCILAMYGTIPGVQQHGTPSNVHNIVVSVLYVLYVLLQCT